MQIDCNRAGSSDAPRAGRPAKTEQQEQVPVPAPLVVSAVWSQVEEAMRPQVDRPALLPDEHSSAAAAQVAAVPMPEVACKWPAPVPESSGR